MGRDIRTLEKAIPLIQSGQIGVIPTDTVYGLVSSALMPEAVEKVFNVKGRDVNKPMIVLISQLPDLLRFGIALTKARETKLTKYWPGPVSIVLPVRASEFTYLHRGHNSVAFRLPDSKPLQEFLSLAGPIVATSANPEGRETAKSIADAYDYFGDRADFYVDGGVMQTVPSTLIRLNDEEPDILRPGLKKEL